MKLERYISSGSKRLRCGYTTGSCAAGAAKAAARMLCSGQPVAAVSLETPAGVPLRLDVEETKMGQTAVSCAVRKDAGDDIDVTDGMLVFAKVSFGLPGEFSVEGGRGVGRVTRPGLDQPVGAAAINRVPRRMILEAVREEFQRAGCVKGASVEIYVPEGERLAKKTYNPRLGIVGGVSILGTSGIVEPMSETALIDTIRAELRMHFAAGQDTVVLTPGDYGETFCKKTLGLPEGRTVVISNFVGEALDYAASLGPWSILLVGHIGKFVKLAGGIFNTHSHVADARMEILAAHGALAGADRLLTGRLLACATTDAALDLLEEAGLLPAVLDSLLKKTEAQIHSRWEKAEIIVYSNVRGTLMESPGARELLRRIKETDGE